MLKSFLKRKKQKGFTLIELIAVMTILGLLALLIIPRFSSVSENANLKVFENNARTLSSQVSLYSATNDGKFPTGGERKRSSTSTPSTPPDATSGLVELEKGLPTDYADRITAADTESYAILGTGSKGALVCTLSLNGKNYVYVYDFGTSAVSKGNTAPAAADTSGVWKAGGTWGDETTTS